jgi:predicted transcriptional regulator
LAVTMILKDAPRCLMATAGGGIGATLAGVGLGVEIKFGVLGIALVAAANRAGRAMSVTTDNRFRATEYPAEQHKRNRRSERD